MENSAELKSEVDDSITADSSYLEQLLAESKQLDPSLTVCHRLLAQEIARVRSGQSKFIELHTDSSTKLSVDVRVPVKEYPQFNFVGKILGPKGNSLKRIQEETRTRMAVLGRGSVRDKTKEEELRKEGGKYAHLNEELHVHVEAFATPIEGYYRLSHALHELRKHLVPDYNDDVTQSQIQELAFLNGKASSPLVRGRGSGFGGRGGGRGRGGHVMSEMGDLGEYGPPQVGQNPMMRDSSWNAGSGMGRGAMHLGGPSSYGRGAMHHASGPMSAHRPASAGAGQGSFGGTPQRPTQY